MGDGLRDGGRELPIPDQAIKVHHRDGTGQSHMRGNGSWSSNSAVGLSFSLLYFRVWAQSESVLPITAMPPPTTKTATGERENFGLAVLV